LEDTSSGIGQNEKDSTEEHWGEDIGTVRSDIFRIGVLNIGGFPVDGHGTKSEELRIYLSNCRLDAIGLTECNAHWKMIPV
jgi:hypothetical protein